MNQEQRGLKGVNAEIFSTLANNRTLRRQLSLDPVINRLTMFLSEPRVDLALSIIEEILRRHGKDVLAEYMKRLAQIEIGVQKFNPRLRDHVNHSVYVFFLGLHLGSRLERIREIKPLTWKLASFLHDVGYPIELFSTSTGEYLKKVHSLRINILQRNLQKLSAPTHMLHIRDFENLVSGKNAFELMSDRLKDWDISIDLKQIYEEKMKKGIIDHGILSSLIVLNIIDALYFKYNPQCLETRKVRENLDWSMKYFKHDILDAVSAIAAHNLTLGDLKSPIVLEKTPTLYFLALCDSLQVWNRFSPKLQVYTADSLHFEFEGNQVLCTLAVSQSDFDRVQNEISRLQSKQVILKLKHV